MNRIMCKCTTGRLSDLQRHLQSAAGQPKLPTTCDLSGLAFSGDLDGPLRVPSNVTICKGSLQLPDGCEVLVSGSQGVFFEHLTIKGAGTLIDVNGGSNVKMLYVGVHAGGSSQLAEGNSELDGDKRAAGPCDGSSCTKSARDNITVSSSMVDLSNCCVVNASGWGLTADNNSHINVTESQFLGNALGNVFVRPTSTFSTWVSLFNGSTRGAGLQVHGTATVSGSELNDNLKAGVLVECGGKAVLLRKCKSYHSLEGSAWCVQGAGSKLVVRDCAAANKHNPSKCITVADGAVFEMSGCTLG